MIISYEQLVDWLEGYQAAWENGDPDLAASLFTADAEYYESPFDKPFIGANGVRDYWSEVPESQRDIHFAYRILNIFDNHALVHWQAEFYRVPSGSRVELDGIFFLEYAADGRCMLLREWWHRRETTG